MMRNIWAASLSLLWLWTPTGVTAMSSHTMDFLATMEQGRTKEDPSSDSSPRLMKRLLEKAQVVRGLQDEDDDVYGLNLTQYALKYLGCQNIHTFDDDLAEEEDSEGVLAMKRFVVFRLCPKETCSSYNQWGCQFGYGEYTLPMEDYLEIVSQYHMEQYHYYCAKCTACMVGAGGSKNYNNSYADNNNGGRRRLSNYQNGGGYYNKNYRDDDAAAVYGGDYNPYANNGNNYYSHSYNDDAGDDMQYNNYNNNRNNYNGNNGGNNNNGNYNNNGNNGGGYYNNGNNGGNNNNGNNGGNNNNGNNGGNNNNDNNGANNYNDDFWGNYNNKYNNNQNDDANNNNYNDGNYNDYNKYNYYTDDQASYYEEDIEEDDDNSQGCQYSAVCANYRQACKDYDSTSSQNYENMRNYMQCAELGNNLGYSGPHCRSDGYTIGVGIYKDENCNYYVDEMGSMQKYTGQSYDDQYLSAFYPKTCISCQASESYALIKDDEEEEQEDGVYEVCEVLYGYSAKCNRALGTTEAYGDAYAQEENQDNVCNFIESLVENNYDEYGEAIVLGDNELSFSNLFQQDVWNEELTKVTQGQRRWLVVSIALFVCLLVYATYLHARLVTRRSALSYPWSGPSSMVMLPPEAKKVETRVHSGITMQRSESGAEPGSGSFA